MKFILLPIIFIPAIILLITSQSIDMQGMWLYYFSAIALAGFMLISREI